MFGTNPIRKAGFVQEGLLIKSIFYTVQGEGPYAGHPAVFIRLIGCNLACWFCDTDFETDPVPMEVDEVASRVLEVRQEVVQRQGVGIRPLVVITGGEPFLQPNLVGLCTLLIRDGYRVQIETAGTVWLTEMETLLQSLRYKPYLDIVVSPKTGKVNKYIAKYACAWKYLIEAGGVAVDGLPVRATQKRGGKQVLLARPPQEAMDRRCVYVQPLHVDGSDIITNLNYKETALTAMEHGYKVSFQMHKYLGVE